MYAAVAANNGIGDGYEASIGISNCYTASAYVFSTTSQGET
jgi:hypothetical protein